MHPLKQLRKIIQPTPPNTGKVIQSTGTSLQVFTRDGQLSSLTPTARDATRYRVGDTVVLKDGIIVGRRNAISSVYVL